MVSIWDVAAPIISFVIFSLLTIPVLKFIRKKKARKNLLLFSWFALVFATGFMTVVNLAIKYYSLPSPYPFLTFTLVNPSLAIFSSSFLIDSVSIYMAILFMFVSSVVFMYGLFSTDLNDVSVERYYAVMLMIIGVLLGAIFAGDLLTLFIFWESSAGATTFLMLFKKTPASMRATLKYLIAIILASSFIIYGLSIIFSLAGTLNFWAVKHAIISLQEQDKGLFVIAFVFIAAGYATEAAVVPFHIWLPDAYVAAPASSTAFIASLIDQGSYYILLRVFVYILTPPDVFEWRVMMAVFSTLTMVVANFAALTEKNIKRLFAYVGIADVGYNLVAITSVTPLGILGNLYFFINGGMTIALAFMIVGIFNRMGVETLDDISGLGRKMPYVSIALVIGTLSFIGFPPMTGFVAKFLVFTAAIEANLTWLAVIGVLTSVIQAIYLINLYTYIFTKPAGKITAIKEPRKLLIPIFIFLIALVVFGLYPQFIFDLINPVASQLPFMP